MHPEILVSAPDLRPSLMSILHGMETQGWLQQLVTTLGFNSRGIWIRNADYLPAMLRNKIRRRVVPDYLYGKTRLIWGREVLRQLASYTAGARVTHHVWRWAETGFDQSVAKKLSGQYEYFYGMEFASLESFRRQKELGGMCLLRLVNAHANYIARMLVKEADKHPQALSSYQQLLVREAHIDTARREAEYTLADLIIANSGFVRAILINEGVAADKIISIPTGFPELPEPAAQPGMHRHRLRFLYAGTLSLRKGVIYLLHAWERLQSDQAELWLAGSIDFPRQFLDRYQERVRILGPVSKSKLHELYLAADVFVLPTLCEGRSHAVLEAMTYGLPVITTRESGCADDVINNENGWIIPAADEGALLQAMTQALENRARLQQYGARSRQKAAAWTVGSANAAHIASLEQFIHKGVTGSGPLPVRT